MLDRLNTLIECMMDKSSTVPVSPRTVSLPGKSKLILMPFVVIMSPPEGSGDIVFPHASIRLSVHLSVTNGVRSINQKPSKIFQ